MNELQFKKPGCKIPLCRGKVCGLLSCSSKKTRIINFKDGYNKKKIKGGVQVSHPVHAIVVKKMPQTNSHVSRMEGGLVTPSAQEYWWQPSVQPAPSGCSRPPASQPAGGARQALGSRAAFSCCWLRLLITTVKVTHNE